MRICKGCKTKYEPMRPLQTTCSVPCALTLVRAKQDKLQRKITREAKQRIKTRAQWMHEAQAAFNAYVRSRDFDLPCICCGNFTPETRGGDYDCGHYRSVGANPELRFNELNAHKCCKRCNQFFSGNIVNYRISLLMRIGEEKVTWLEGPHPAKKYTIEDLKNIKAEYKQKLKDLASKPHYPV